MAERKAKNEIKGEQARREGPIILAFIFAFRDAKVLPRRVNDNLKKLKQSGKLWRDILVIS
jgi:hypothetical protein